MTDHTDPGHVTGAHERPARGGGTRVGDSGSPVGSPLTIVLAVIAVAVGFLIFRSISDDGDALGGAGLPAGGGTTTTTVAGVTPPVGVTAAPGAATTTAAPTGPVTEGGTVIVANASGANGAATLMTDLIDAAGWTTGEPTDDNSDTPRDDTVVYYQPGGNTQAVAESLARELSGADVVPMPAEIPTASGDLSGNILVLLGTDFAGDEELPGPPPAAPAAPTTPTTTA